MRRDEEYGESEAFCRICLGGDNEDDSGDLLTPCNCSGSLRYVHSKCFETWTKNGPALPEAGPIVTTLFGVLAFTGYYWLCMRIRCELCGSIYRVKKVRLHWMMRWLVFILLLSALLVTCGLFIHTGPVLFRAPYAAELHTSEKVEFMEQFHGRMRDVSGSGESRKFFCMVPPYRRWLFCFEAHDTTTRQSHSLTSWMTGSKKIVRIGGVR